MNTAHRRIVTHVLFASMLGWCLTAQAAVPEGSAESPAGPDYLLGPEDVVSISVWKDEHLTKEVVVRPDGMVSFPLVGDVPAAGRTVEDLRLDIAKRLSRFIPSAHVSVSLTKLLSYRIYVLGRVAKPGEFLKETATYTRQQWEEMDRLRKLYYLLDTYGILRYVARFVRRETGMGEVGFYDRIRRDVLSRPDQYPNITGTLDLIQKVGRDMRARARGRILITGSVAGFMPGSFQAVYSATKAFLNSFAFTLRNELQDTGVTVTCLMPGATETGFFARADMCDTKVGQADKDDPADVAQAGVEAMLQGDGDVVTGWQNKLQTTLANVTPSELLAGRHRKIAEPGSRKK